jgi:DNA-binding NarL/FixJ family response regulator
MVNQLPSPGGGKVRPFTSPGLAAFGRAPLKDPPQPPLTRGQRDVLRCLLAGAAEKAVAAELGISQQTVHTHVKSIYLAYRVQSRAVVKCLAGPPRYD